MAERRMFSQKIVESDAFTDMPLSAQALYFHLNMNADDDGFVNNPKKIARSITATEKDLKILIEKRFLISYPSGVVVIKHWKMHNSIKADRYKPTEYQEEYAMLYIKPNKAYTENPEHAGVTIHPDYTEPERNQDGTETEPEWSRSGTSLEPERFQNGAQTEPQDRLGKDSKEYCVDTTRARARAREGEKTGFDGFEPPTLEAITEYCRERGSPVDPNRFYDYYNARHWIDSKGNPVTEWKSRLISWEDTAAETQKPKNGRKGSGRKKQEPRRPFEPTNFDELEELS